MEDKVIVKLKRGKKDGLCLLSVKVNGSSVQFMIDTGAYHSFVGLDVLQSTGLKHVVDPNHSVMATVGRQQEDKHVGGATLKLEVLKGFTAEHDFCVSAAGTSILGTDFLRNYDAELQFTEREDYLLLSPRCKRLEIGEQFRVYVPCQVFGKTVQVQVDSGANISTLQSDVVPASALFHGVMKTNKVKGIGGIEKQTVCHLQPQQAEVAGHSVTLRYPTVFFKDTAKLSILDVNFLRENYVRMKCRKQKIKFARVKRLK